MTDSILDLLLSDVPPTPAQREALRQAAAEDPDLDALARQWDDVCAGVRRGLDDAVPDRTLLAAYALVEGGYGDVLDAEDRARVDAARPALERALAAHPALADVVADVQSAARDFDACWREHDAAPRADRPSRRADRSPRPRRRSRALTLAWRTVAVASVVLFGLVAMFYLQREEGMTVVVAEVGEVQTLTLSDGTSVRLMPGSRLEYPSDGAFGRFVRLDGRAFFDVAAGSQGFTVETATARTTVLGTQFGVDADAALTQVVLVSGAVALAPRDDQDAMVVLAPGQQSRVARGEAATRPEAVDLTQALEWTGLVVLRGTPAGTAARYLAERFETPVTVHASLAAEPVTGTFDADATAREVLDALAATLGARVEVDGDGFRLVP